MRRFWCLSFDDNYLFKVFFAAKIVNAAFFLRYVLLLAGWVLGERGKRCFRRRYDSGFSDKKMEVGIRLNFVCLVERTEKRTSMKGVATK